MKHIMFTLNHPNAMRPLVGTPGAAGVDLFSADVHIGPDNVVVNTGLRTAFDDDHVLMVFGRSGYARKHSISLVNGVGIIDSDYRGDIQLIFQKGDHSDEALREIFKPGNRVAQAILIPCPAMQWLETGKLPETERGDGGFGSTGG